MSSKIIFLDFDGVMLTQKSSEEYGYGVLEPNACALVKKLCEASDAKIVVCSSWLSPDSSDVRGMMQKAGLEGHLHEKWRIGNEGEDVQAIDKADLIIQWTKDHDLKPKDIVILDDKLAQYPRISNVWKNRVVTPDAKKGLQEIDYITAKQLFGLELEPDEKRAIFKIDQSRNK